MSSWNSLFPPTHARCKELGKAVNASYPPWQTREGPTPCPDMHSLVSLLKASGNQNDPERGIRLHGFILQAGLLASQCSPLGNALVDMYAKCGMLATAQQVFDRLPTCDVATWNALMTGYVRHGLGQEALNRFSLMEDRSILPDVVTLTCVSKACGSLKDVRNGRGIHGHIERRGLLRNNHNVAIGNALIDMYGKCGSIAEAEDVFQMLLVRNAISWSTLITLYVQNECYEEAFHSYRQMRHEGVVPDETLLVCVLKACCGARGIAEGMEVHAHVEKMGFSRSNAVVGTALVDMYAKWGMLAESKIVFHPIRCGLVVSWNALISGFIQHERPEEALGYSQEMHRHGLSPDEYTLTCSLKACGMIGAFDKGRELHDDIERRGFIQTSQHVGNALVDMYVKCGMVANAVHVFNRLQTRNVVSWNTLIAGQAQGGELGEILCFLEAMRREGIKPNAVTFISILNACSHVGLVDKGETYFQAMVQCYGVIPTVEHQCCFVDLVGRAGQLENVALAMEKTPFFPNTVMWLTVLSACRKWGDIQIGSNAFAQVVALDGNDSAPYICMRRLYADASTEEKRKFITSMKILRHS